MMNINIAIDCTAGYPKDTYGFLRCFGGVKHGFHLVPFRTYEESECYLSERKCLMDQWYKLIKSFKMGELSMVQYK